MGDCAASDAEKGGNVEDYYRRMIEENPCNSLILRNYAHFLSQVRFEVCIFSSHFFAAL